ncbi:efflux RND transporter periplasmic adaptor subunit [Marinobacter xestospongiae]|uniref:Efflux RND transporter periplasmic adaptor subunit n=1 Tax=Marinobacter xestospongiae TaxID=994319 RepID=A0ABU3VUU4_9GAMM|nr:efflux RND transporter periplasmic adaptor subunit [Marinobacter xestospongiae]MDV2078037.1 efflux RND transporter periplasmic adaptor subunit [Marinobacter xestospongiae]
MERLTNDTRRRSPLAGGLALVLAIFLSGCEAQSEEAMAMPPPPEVDVAQVLAEPVTLWQSFTGRVAATDAVMLRPRVSGYIQQVAFDEGALVEAGDLLFQIDPRPYQARVQAAQAELAQANSQLELARSEAGRARSLLKSRAISQEEYDQRDAALMGAQASVAAARAALTSAELDLEYTRVTAPVSGRAGRALVTRGNLANADQTELTTVVSVDPMYVYFEADEQTAAASQALLAAGGPQTVKIQLGNDGDQPLSGELDFIDNQLNASTGTLQYRAVLANPGERLKPGQFARVEMPVAQLDQALMVNRKAVLTDQDRRFVYVINDQNQATPRHVTVGRQVDDLMVIRDGLANGDRVIVNGVQKVFYPGMEVSPQQVAMRETGDDTTVVAASP